MNLEKIKEAVSPIIEGLNLELVDVEYSKQHGQNNLTIFISGENPITFTECEKVHVAIDEPLEQLNPSSDSPYVLNVSSPGLDRPFKTERDFIRNMGKMVEIKLYAPYRGSKIYEGILLEKNPHTVAIEATIKGKAERFQFEISKIVFVRPYVSFEGIEN